MQGNITSAAKINPSTAALLLLHWQNDIAAPGGKIAGNMPERLANAHTVEHAQSVLEISRKKGMLVVYVAVAHRTGYPELPAKLAPMPRGLTQAGALIQRTWGAEIIDQLKPLDHEIVIFNYSTSGFTNTELDIILRNKGISDLVMTGVATNWVVESTARDGVNRGYYIHVLKDCCASHSDEMHNWTLTNILPNLGAVLDSEAYIAALK